jgi:hypothetical protein
MWFTFVFLGTFLLLAGLALAAHYYATSWNAASPGVGPTGGLAIMLLGAVLFIGGVYLRWTNPHLGILEPSWKPGESEKDWAKRMNAQRNGVERPVSSSSDKRGGSR